MSFTVIAPARKKRLRTVTALLGMGTATPPTVTQKEATQIATEMACETPEQRAWLARVFLRCGIETRGTVLLGEEARMEALRAFYPPRAGVEDRGPTTAARMARYAAEAPALAEKAAARALVDAGVDAQAVTHLITVSCTGFVAPGLDAALISRLGLPATVRRLHVGFMGCHAAFNALATARDAVLANADARVLVCCVELCSLHFAYGWDPGKLVANALFADGAAAVVLGRPQETNNEPAIWQLRDTASFLLPESAEAMTWRIGDHGFEMTLAPSVPEIVRQHLGAWCDNWLAKHDLRISDIAQWAIHPGGPKILTAVAEALGLPGSALEHSREILARHGNMSSTTVLFILEQMAQRDARGPCVAIGLGPGLMAEGMLLVK